jgi:hypothetical protein
MLGGCDERGTTAEERVEDDITGVGECLDEECWQTQREGCTMPFRALP